MTNPAYDGERGMYDELGNDDDPITETYFAKLYATVTSSSLWSEELCVRVVFITMLARCNEVGYYGASIDGLARDANISEEEVERAIAILEAPDRRSRSPEYEGRRVKRVRGGWLVLNAPKYRELRTRKAIDAARRKKAQRERDRRLTDLQTALRSAERVQPVDGDDDAADAAARSPSEGERDMSHMSHAVTESSTSTSHHHHHRERVRSERPELQQPELQKKPVRREDRIDAAITLFLDANAMNDDDGIVAEFIRMQKSPKVVITTLRQHIAGEREADDGQPLERATTAELVTTIHEYLAKEGPGSFSPILFDGYMGRVQKRRVARRKKHEAVKAAATATATARRAEQDAEAESEERRLRVERYRAAHPADYERRRLAIDKAQPEMLMGTLRARTIEAQLAEELAREETA